MGILNFKLAKNMENIRDEERIQALDGKSFWLENDLTILYGPAGTGKSIFAVGLAAEVSKKRQEKVLYVDFELTEREFMSRFTKDFLGEFFCRAEPTTQEMMTLDGSRMVDYIEKIYLNNKIRFFVIDNISIILDDPTNFDKAKRFVLMFKCLVDKYSDMSILLVGHTPKRDKSAPVSSDTLAGSKALSNFCKSAFAIVPSVKGKNIVYVKQTKTRNGECIYNDENVLEYKLIKKENNLIFNELGTGKEAEHLFTEHNRIRKDNEQRDKLINKLHKAGKSTREISKFLKKKGIALSHTGVNIVINQND